MSDEILALFATYGLPVTFFIAAIGQFGIPLPTSLAILSMGALATQGDVSLASAYFWIASGAIIGDQAGYSFGKTGIRKIAGSHLERPRIAAKIAGAERLSEKWGALGIFLSKWLVTPLGPWMNLTSGMTGFHRGWFTFYAIAGEAVWIGAYLTFGYLFSSQISALSDFISNASYLIVALLFTGFLGWRLQIAWKKARLKASQQLADSAAEPEDQ